MRHPLHAADVLSLAVILISKKMTLGREMDGLWLFAGLVFLRDKRGKSPRIQEHDGPRIVIP